MTRAKAILGAVLLTVAGCAARTPPTQTDINCAISDPRKETDGGYGGTGRAPEECPPAP